MYLSSKNLLASAVLLAAAPAKGQFPSIDVDNLVPQWMPQCFDGQEAVNPFDVVDCIRTNSNPSCVEMSIEESIMGMVQCVNISMSESVASLIESFAAEEVAANARQGDSDSNNPLKDFLQNALGVDMDVEELLNIGRVFVNSTLECLDPYANCVQQTIQEAMETQLNPCINQTLRELVECGRSNQDLCLESCSNVTGTFEQNNPFERLKFESVETCDGIQTNLMNPLCDVVGCCEPCVAKVEALMKCIVNEQLDQVPALGDSNTCEDLFCPVVSQRRQLRPAATTFTNPTRILEETTNPMSGDECLQYSPGLTGDDTKEFSARSAVFLPCVSDSFLGAVKTPTPVDSTQEESSSSSSSGFQAGSLGLVVMVVVAYLVL
jgi:hypothetical protein